MSTIQVYIHQGWDQGSFFEAEAKVKAEAEVRQCINVLNRGEARQRQRARGRGEADYIRGKAEARRPPEKKPSFPYMYSSAKIGRFKSNCMTEGKWLRGPALLG